MTDDYKEIIAHCESECTDVSIAFGIEFTGSIDELGTEWIYEGLADSFWENSYEFDAYVNSAKELKTTKGLSYNDALKQIFGRFIIFFEINGSPVKQVFDVDVNEQMYALLSEL